MTSAQPTPPTASPAAPPSQAGRPDVPPWAAPVLYAVLTLILFRAFVFGDGMLLGSDTLNGGYAAREFFAGQLRAGTFPRWAPEILGGTPFLEALSGGDALYPTSILLVLMEPFRALGWKLVLHVFLAGLFMYGWLRALGASRAAALVSGTAYMFAPFMVSLVRPGHDGKLFVTALAPLMFWTVERFFARPTARQFAVVGLVVALVLFTTHFQMAYFLFGSVGLYAVFRAVQLWRGGEASSPRSTPYGFRVGATRLMLFLAAALAGFGGAAVQFLPSALYVTQDSRRTRTTREDSGEIGVEWSSSWSMHPEEAMSLVIPEFAGNGAGGSAWASDTYWGRNFLRDSAEYAGVITLILAAVSFTGSERRRQRRFFAVTSAVALLYALGPHTPVWRVFYEVLPGIRLFRTPASAIFLFGFGTATLAGFGVDRLFQATADVDPERWRRVRRRLFAGAGLLVALALLVSSGALTSFWTSFVFRDIDAERLQRLARLRPSMSGDAWLGAALGVATAALAWALRSRRVRPAMALGALVFLVAADEARIDATFVQVIDFQRWAAPDPTTEALLRRERGTVEPYRLLSFVDRGQDVKPAIYGVELAAGHHPNDLARYRELIGMVGSDLPRNLYNANIQRLLNVRYLLWPDYHGQGPEDDTVVFRTEVGGEPYKTLHARPGLPRARLVAGAVLKPEDEQVPYMLSGAFDPAAEVVLSEPPPLPLAGGPVTGSVTWEERTPNRLRLSATTDREALLVVADNWFPAWHATVDGRPAPILRAYHALRAVPLSPGTHSVEMVYRSTVVGRSLALSAGVLLLLSGTVVWGWLRERRS